MPPVDSLKTPGSDELSLESMSLYNMILIRSWEQSPRSFQVTVGFTFSHYKPMVTSSSHSNQSFYWADKLKQCAYSPPYDLSM